MSVHLLFGIGCVIVLAGVLGSITVERHTPHADGAALGRAAKAVTYLGIAVAAFAMISGLIIG